MTPPTPPTTAPVSAPLPPPPPLDPSVAPAAAWLFGPASVVDSSPEASVREELAPGLVGDAVGKKHMHTPQPCGDFFMWTSILDKRTLQISAQREREIGGEHGVPWGSCNFVLVALAERVILAVTVGDCELDSEGVAEDPPPTDRVTASWEEAGMDCVEGCSANGVVDAAVDVVPVGVHVGVLTPGADVASVSPLHSWQPFWSESWKQTPFAQQYFRCPGVTPKP